MRKLKEILKKFIEEEADSAGIEVTGPTLELALQKACSNLGVGLSELDYEIIEFGNKGMFGVGKKDYLVRVYKAVPKMDIFKSVEMFRADGFGVANDLVLAPAVHHRFHLLAQLTGGVDGAKKNMKTILI